MTDNNQDFIQVLLEKIEKDDLPTNVFDVEGTDPLVLLGKMNEIIGQLKNFQSSVNTSNSTANEALSKAEDAVTTSGQALSNASTALGTANQAIGTANQAIDTANQALETAQDISEEAGKTANEAKTIAETANQNSNQAVTTANEAKSTAQEALDQVVAGLGTKVYRDTTLLSSLDIKPIEDDIANNATAITALQNGKVDKVTGKQLSTEDFTTAEKNKLAGLNNYDDTQVKAEITDLQSADEQNVKLTGNQTIEGIKKFKDSINLYTNNQNASISLFDGSGTLSFSNTIEAPNIRIGTTPIIQSGSNTNGYYTKFADGTLICRYSFTDKLLSGHAVTFPHPFISTEDLSIITQQARDNGISAQWINGQAINKVSKTGFNVYAGYSESSTIYWKAIGRWK